MWNVLCVYLERLIFLAAIPIIVAIVYFFIYPHSEDETM